jgi:hypothetical protein
VITEVINVSKIAAFITDQSGVELEFETEFDIGYPGFNIAEVLASAKVTKTSALSTNFIGKIKSTPLFKAIGVKKKLFGPWNVVYANAVLSRMNVDLTSKENTEKSSTKTLALDLTSKENTEKSSTKTLAVHVSHIVIDEVDEVDYTDFDTEHE